MKYAKTVEAKFIDRPNRFVAHVELSGTVETVHVKNTGRCKELLYEGVRVILFDSDNPNRKTRYDLIAVWKANFGWINIDSQAPNAVVREWLSDENQFFQNITFIKPEYKYGNSRIDFYIEQGDKKSLIEVKGCTLEVNHEGYFPDAPTERGVKHLYELAQAKSEGIDAYVAFVIAMEGINVVHPNVVTHPEFGEALKQAYESGVKILYLCCEVAPDELKIVKCIEGKI